MHLKNKCLLQIRFKMQPFKDQEMEINATLISLTKDNLGSLRHDNNFIKLAVCSSAIVTGAFWVAAPSNNQCKTRFSHRDKKQIVVFNIFFPVRFWFWLLPVSLWV